MHEVVWLQLPASGAHVSIELFTHSITIILLPPFIQHLQANEHTVLKQLHRRPMVLDGAKVRVSNLLLCEDDIVV